MGRSGRVESTIHIELRTFVSTDHQETFDLSTSFFMVSLGVHDNLRKRMITLLSVFTGEPVRP